LPTFNWLPGEILADTHHIAAPNDMAAGNYRVLVGLYHARSGARLRSGAADAFTLTSIEVP
jgi:hypothetical protein